MKHHISKSLNAFLGNHTVLVVEPASNFRNSLKQFLLNLKVKRVKLVSSVADARREMLTTKIGMFIVEWSLDDVNGLQFCRELRRTKAFRDTPFVLLSSENARKDVVLAAEVHIDAYLLKPFSYEDFSNQLAAVVKAQTAETPFAESLESADDHLAKGALAEAEKAYQSALSMKERSAKALCGLARVHQLRGDLGGAKTWIKKAIVANPEFIEAYRIMLEICETGSDRAGVVQAASMLTSLSPENPRYTLILAKAYLDMGHLEGSENFFRLTLTLSPRLAEAYKGLGNVYVAQQQFEKAVKNFKRALDLDADDISTLNSLGMTYVRMEQYKLGIDKYMIALKFDPHDVRVLFNLGHANEKRGDLEKAKTYYGQALIHRPGYDKAKRGIERIDKFQFAVATPLTKEPSDKRDEPEALAPRAGHFKKSS